MKQFKSIAILIMLTAFLFSASSCVVLRKKDNGKHKGWFKDKKNPQKKIYKKPTKGVKKKVGGQIKRLSGV